MSVFETRRYVEAPRDLVWEVVADVELFGEVAPNLKSAHKVSGEGVGMRRTCYNLKGQGWSETCNLWEEGHRYSMEVDTSHYPYPLEKMRGTWGVEAAPGGTIITMRYDYRFKYGALGSLLDHLFARRLFAPVCEKILDNWEQEIRERQHGEGSKS
jgi:ribosome-associated toxin RatA of RatAB toxin-antitoxin module